MSKESMKTCQHCNKQRHTNKFVYDGKLGWTCCRCYLEHLRENYPGNKKAIKDIERRVEES